MKVRDLTLNVNLNRAQKITVNDRRTAQTLTTQNQKCFELGSDEVERVLNLKVTSFEVSDLGLRIWAE